jgi:hypothetical protein
MALTPENINEAMKMFALLASENEENARRPRLMATKKRTTKAKKAKKAKGITVNVNLAAKKAAPKKSRAPKIPKALKSLKLPKVSKRITPAIGPTRSLAPQPMAAPTMNPGMNNPLKPGM